jgi:hypothetical protein
MTTDDQPKRVRITNPDHPHAGETGTLTGRTVKMLTGAIMAEVDLDNDVDGCYVKPSDCKRI